MTHWWLCSQLRKVVHLLFLSSVVCARYRPYYLRPESSSTCAGFPLRQTLQTDLPDVLIRRWVFLAKGQVLISCWRRLLLPQPGQDTARQHSVSFAGWMSRMKTPEPPRSSITSLLSIFTKCTSSTGAATGPLPNVLCTALKHSSPNTRRALSELDRHCKGGAVCNRPNRTPLSPGAWLSSLQSALLNKVGCDMR